MSSLEALQEEVARLPLEGRAAVAAFALKTLPPPDYEVSDEDVTRRLDELKSGKVEGLSHEQLWSKVDQLTSK